MGKKESEKLFRKIDHGEVHIDLEALLSKETHGEVMTALQEQLGAQSRGDVLDVLAFYDNSGRLAEVSITDVHGWFKGKLPPLKTSEAIEGAVAGIAGKYEPILTRFYQKN